MKYILDTNICIYIIKKRPVQVIEHLRNLSISKVGISSITLSELEYGVEKSKKQKQNKIALTGFIAPLEIAVYDQQAALVYGKIRAYLEKIGQPIGSLDLLIAAHAISLNSSLVTNNEKEFKKIPMLKVENWV